MRMEQKLIISNKCVKLKSVNSSTEMCGRWDKGESVEESGNLNGENRLVKRVSWLTIIKCSWVDITI